MGINKLPLEIKELIFEHIGCPVTAQNYFFSILLNTCDPSLINYAEFLQFVTKSKRYKSSKKLAYYLQQVFKDDEVDVFAMRIPKRSFLLRMLAKEK